MGESSKGSERPTADMVQPTLPHNGMISSTQSVTTLPQTIGNDNRAANRSKIEQVTPVVEAQCTAEASLLEPPINVLRLSLHPGGLAPFIANLGDWKKHLLERLAHQIQVTADPALAALEKELKAYPADEETPGGHADYGDVFVPFELMLPQGKLSFFSTITVFVFRTVL